MYELQQGHQTYGPEVKSWGVQSGLLDEFQKKKKKITNTSYISLDMKTLPLNVFATELGIDNWQ